MQSIILAAGRSTRMGRQKLLMPLEGRPLVDRVIGAVLESGFDKIFVVASRETLNGFSPLGGAEYILNPDPDRGQDSSFRVGLEALAAGIPFAVFLGDKPLITASEIMELRRQFEALPACRTALVPQKDGVPGHPGFYTSPWRKRFLNATDSARAVLRQHSDEIAWVEGSDGCFFDVDTPEDYRRITPEGKHRAEL